MKFGEKLKYLRTEKKLTQADLAKAVGVSLRTYASYEQEGRYPRKRELYGKLAEHHRSEPDTRPGLLLFCGTGLCWKSFRLFYCI